VKAHAFLLYFAGTLHNRHAVQIRIPRDRFSLKTRREFGVKKSKSKSGVVPAVRRAGQASVRRAIGMMTPWPHLGDPVEGYSIILGVPWMLRHILDVNLRAIARCDLKRLVDIHIVLDRTEKPWMQEFAEVTSLEWKDLPLQFSWYPTVAGRVCERANISTFYNGLNILTALKACRARAAVLHDFDLYPLRPDYFDNLAGGVLDRGLRFSGLERTHFDGVTYADNIFGTWGLGMDAAWLRNQVAPADILHRQARLEDGRFTRLDPFSWLQTREERRGQAIDMSHEDVCHVRNLCSSYLRLHSSKPVYVAWRLHYLAYLEDVSMGSDQRMRELMRAMGDSQGHRVRMYGKDVDFSGTDWTCGNVLRRELHKLDEFLFGEVRPVVGEFVERAAEFFASSGSVPKPVETIAKEQADAASKRVRREASVRNLAAEPA
jgi:hypothetical protein